MDQIASSSAYFVNTRPQVTWAWDLADRNLEFLRSIDPAYFAHVATTQGPLLDSGEKSAQYAAAAIRIAHAQAVETLFALLGALAQAPDMAIGWMLAYNNEDLREVTSALVSRQGMSDRSRWKVGVSLKELADIVHEGAAWDRVKREGVASAYLRLWRHWAGGLLNDDQTAEYNSLKHGSRAALGGHSVSIGQETVPGVPAPPESMVSLGGSAFGSTFYKSIPLDGKLHSYPRKQSRNWSAGGLTAGLGLLAMSIRNVTSCLRILGGDDPSTCAFEIPQDPAAFDLPLVPTGGLTFSSMDLQLGVANIERFTKQEVLAVLNGSGAPE